MQEQIIVQDGQRMPRITVAVTVLPEHNINGDTKVVTDYGSTFWIDFDYVADKPKAGDRVEVSIAIYTGIARTCKPILKQSSIF